MPQIDAVVFDIGRVLIEWNPERFYDNTIGETRRREMFDAIDLHAMNELIDLGNPFRETVYTCADQHPKYRAEIRMWHDNWIEMAGPAISDSVRLLRAIRAKDTSVFALSNLGIGTLDVACKAYPFLNEFDQRFISGQLQATKPRDRIYELLEQGSGIAPENILFADDLPANIKTATNRGWHAHLFKDPAGWAKALIHHNVLTAEEAAL